jgi:glycosyltransferase involved in cell wall biosynthesis
VTSPLRVLCLDIEGGFGGSSRSLYQSISHMARSAVSVEVWCRRDGPIRARYDALGIPSHIMPDMPHISSLPALSRNAFVYLRFLFSWPSGSTFRRKLADAARRFDVIHFNHEGLFLLMRHLRRRSPDAALTGHVRTLLSSNVFSRWQYRTLVRAADRVVFITENESENVARMTGWSGVGPVIYNIVTPPQLQSSAPNSSVPRDARLKVAVLSNFAILRGTDRLVEIAQALVARGRRDILFVVAGNMRAHGSVPGELGRVMRRGGGLGDFIKRQGLDDMFVFLGHVAEPEGVLAACDVLLKPSRDATPWGRDILEALAFGRPVIATGRYSRFVEPESTGFLLPEYSPGAVADLLLRLDADRELGNRLGAAGAARVATLCDGRDRAADLLTVWRQAAVARQTRTP